MPSQKQYTERTDNIRAIFSALRECGSLTRNEISQKLGLSWACVSDLTAMLISEGIVLARSPSGEKSFRGRTPSYLCLSEENCFLGVDINNNGITFRKESAAGELIAVHTDKREIDTEDALAETVLHLPSVLCIYCHCIIYFQPAQENIPPRIWSKYGENINKTLLTLLYSSVMMRKDKRE